jgi:outer membrane protein OmpA-like peptidoglycan-associated protein
MNKSVMRLAAVLVFALSTSACSTIDSAISDVTGDDTPSASAPTDANGFPADTAPPGQTSDAAAPTSPDLAAIPDKPSGVTSPDAQRATADSLAADRARSGYSAEALRGGTEAAAPPPGPAPAPGAVADNAPPAASPPAAPPPSTPSTDSTVPGPGASPAAVADNTPPPSAPAAPVTTASIAPPPGAQPAVPAVPGAPGAMPTVVADGNLGFKPSTAPALDPSVSQFVPAPIIARYQQTASNAGVATGPLQPSPGADPAVARNIPRGRAMGGPEAMSGSVVANLDAINQSTPSVYANANGLPPAAVVMFPTDGTALDAAGRAQVRAAVTAFQQRGGTGFIKVVGHSSSRTGNMPVEKHLIAIFQKSQARANAVAKEIIRQGVPASRVLVEAVGDSQPVYYESMPQGEAGNRRAEIFLQS